MHAPRLPALPGIADVGNLWVAAGEPWSELRASPLEQAADRLRLARLERLLDAATPDAARHVELLQSLGFPPSHCTERGWERPGRAL